MEPTAESNAKPTAESNAEPTAKPTAESNSELATELVARVDRDQQARSELPKRPVDHADWARVEAVDAENTAWLKGILDRHGWPRRSDVGDEAAVAAWLLAQHADRDPAFQRECLALLEQAVSDGEASPGHLAYLTDRVLRAEGKPQLYGTQFWYLPENLDEPTPQPIEDLAGLDERRRKVGFGPFADHLAGIRRSEAEDD
ncbi:DUF6624 domain-containing protein [Micromonospora sp. NPDC049523]|uniref:DUF6624 domain-containing protein n=1 Tax=Micromonospora sp. NPDC049523 TaxID=3155921 RepID=UPI003435A8E8